MSSRQPSISSALAGVLLLILLGAGCASGTVERDAERTAELRQSVSRLLQGSFTSAAQAAADPENYFDIRLEVVPIWAARDDGPWLYVEQAAASALERPYRQRVYHLEGDVETGLRSIVYELPGDPKEQAGAWRDAEPLAAFGPEDLLLLEGCTVYLSPGPDGVWSGGTRADECGTEWGGAKYATSEVTLAADYMESWDRGYDESGEQVWGAVEGPYRFDRVPE